MRDKVYLVFDKTKVSLKIKSILTKKVNITSLKNSNTIIVLGGDGFMLQTLKKLHKYKKPFYGINSGNYGFLMNKFSNENIKERKVVILFLHDSVGELFVTLPIFWFLKNYTDVEIYFVSHHSDILKRMNISKRYVEIMQEIGSFHFGNLKSIKLLAYLWLENNATIQMSCNLGARRIDRIYYSFLKKLHQKKDFILSLVLDVFYFL